MLEQRAAKRKKSGAIHCIESLDRWLANKSLHYRRSGGDILNTAKLGRVMTDALLAGDEEHGGGNVRGEDGAVVEGATDGGGNWMAQHPFGSGRQSPAKPWVHPHPPLVLHPQKV